MNLCPKYKYYSKENRGLRGGHCLKKSELIMHLVDANIDDVGKGKNGKKIMSQAAI